MVFTGFDGTQLFINNPSGDNIYAHRVTGDALARAKEIIASDMPQTAPEIADKMICLSERKFEFIEALGRGKDNDFEVYADWEKDTFVVVNRDNKNEYRVIFETRGKKLFGMCDCPDFKFRKRTCKHLGCVLVDALFTVGVSR